MRSLAIVIALIVITSSVALASDWGNLAKAVLAAKASERLADCSGEAGVPAPQTSGPMARGSFRVAWYRKGVIDARSDGRGWGYGWEWWRPDHQAIKAWSSQAGQNVGIMVMADYRPLEESHGEAAGRGRDPRTAPKPGLHRSPAGLLQVAVTFGGYRKSDDIGVGNDGRRGRYHREWYRVRILGRILSVENADPLAVAEGAGESVGDILDIETDIAGIWLGRFLSRPALADKAIAAACGQLMQKLAQQVLGNGLKQDQAIIRVARVDGPRVVLVTADHSDIRDAGVTEEMEYDLLGAGVEGSRGRPRIARVVIEHVDADLAEGRIVELYSGSPAVGQTVTLVPYQSHFKN